jgi:radical SAM PhpK family P-methyltransferase
MKTKADIDCLLIGNNEMDFGEYEKNVGKMGMMSGAYRDLNLSFIRYNNKPYTAPQIFNIFHYDENSPAGIRHPLNMGESLCASIAYLGTYLHRRGFTFDFINSFQDEKARLAEKLVEYNILTIAITTTLYVSVFPILEIIEFIKKYNNTARIIVGGPFIYTQTRTRDSASLDYLFKTVIGADVYVNSSQGEAALVKIIQSLKNNSPLEKINNIYYQNNGGYVKTPAAPENNKLADNMVNWDLFAPRINEYVNIRTSISCPFSCAFCGFPEHAGTYQTVQVEQVEKELNALQEIEKLKSVYFIDDTFNVPLNRFKTLLRRMIKNRFQFRWHAQFRVQYSDRETIELMKESRCEGVYLGLESGNNHVLKNMNKAVNVEKYYEGIALLKEYEIPTIGSFIIGFPGETYDTVQDTVKFIKESGLDFYRTQLWYCDHITPIWRKKDIYKIEGESFEWTHDTMDAKTAMDLIEEIFLSIREPIWVPQYNFDFDNVMHLLDREMDLEQIKRFLKSFYRGVKEKLIEPDRKEISFEVIEQLKKNCLPGSAPVELFNERVTVNNSEAEFNFDF